MWRAATMLFSAGATFPEHATSKVIKTLKTIFSNFKGQGSQKLNQTPSDPKAID
jgi:hypothetical protein